jgi:hypothetical protein
LINDVDTLELHRRIAEESWDDPEPPERIDASFASRFGAPNSAAIRLPNRVLGTKIPLPIGWSRHIQPIEVKVFCSVRQAIFERQNKFFRCLREIRKSARARPYPVPDPRQLAKFHLPPCREILNGA